MIQDGKMITKQDLDDLREELNLSLMDHVWLYGVFGQTFKTTTDKKNSPIKNVSVCILARYLHHYPEETPVPRMPDYLDIFDMIQNNLSKESGKTSATEASQKHKTKKYRRTSMGLDKTMTYLGDDISPRRFGMLFGSSGWSGNRWYHGGRPSPTIERIFYILMRALEREGIYAIEKYLGILEKEAKARGFEDGLKGVFRKGNWKTAESKKDKEE